MNPKKLLLNAYFEALYNILLDQKSSVISAIDKLLPLEFAKLDSARRRRADTEKLAAYRYAAIAFVDERIEMYNPIGLQYTFDKKTCEFAKQLELQLNWFDSTNEFNTLLEEISEIETAGFDEEKLPQLANQLIRKFGAFPDKTIIESYNRLPSLQKLPDFVVAQSIEKIINDQNIS
jgi:hypothetical protein